MCGRYASTRSRVELIDEFGVEQDRVAEPLPPDYNVAPTKRIYGVLAQPERDDRSGAGDDGRSAARPAAARQLRVLRWGLVPSWAKDPSVGGRMINARAETVAEKPAFRSAFAKRRCLLPADGYYEWQKPPAGSGGPKQPYFIRRADDLSLAFAGLYELWRARDRPDDDPSAWLWTATIITTTAPDELGQIHDRMPMVIDPDRWEDWLDPVNTDPTDLKALLVPAATSGLITYPVSLEVNSVRNNGPELIEALDPVASGAGTPGGAK